MKILTHIGFLDINPAVVTSIKPAFAIPGKKKRGLHLTGIIRFEFTYFQFHSHKTLKLPVIKQQIDKKFLIPSLNPVLVAMKAKYPPISI